MKFNIPVSDYLTAIIFYRGDVPYTLKPVHLLPDSFFHKLKTENY